MSLKAVIGLILAAFLAGRYPAKAPKNINITVAHIASPVSIYGLEMKYFSSKLFPINFSVIIAKISPVYPEIVVINIDSCKIFENRINSVDYPTDISALSLGINCYDLCNTECSDFIV